MADLALEWASGWSEVSPRADAPGLLVEREGRLTQLRSDFSQVHDLGKVGPVECPIAYDSVGQVAYRYVCESRLGRPDFSELRAYDLSTGAVRSLLELPLSHWVLWLLEWIAGNEGQAGRLFGLLASDLTSEEAGVVIRHQLFAVSPGEARPRTRPVCRDAYHPLALSRARRELVFAGAEGLYIVGLRGERRFSLCDGERPSGRGAAFDPSGRGRVALGGEGLYLWDYEAGRCQCLARQGQYPTWSHDGAGLWYSESSSDLFYFDLQTRQSKRVLSVRNNRNPEFSFARAARQSACGRYLALPLSGKRLKGVARGKLDPSVRERVYEWGHTFCLLDLKKREFWRHNKFFTNFSWIDPSK